jgi:ABC-type proline/glycine betaine transport system ATPase subunit
MWRELYENLKYRENSKLVGEIVDIINIMDIFKERPDISGGAIERVGVIRVDMGDVSIFKMKC